MTRKHEKPFVVNLDEDVYKELKKAIHKRNTARYNAVHNTVNSIVREAIIDFIEKERKI